MHVSNVSETIHCISAIQPLLLRNVTEWSSPWLAFQHPIQSHTTHVNIIVCQHLSSTTFVTDIVTSVSTYLVTQDLCYIISGQVKAHIWIS